MNKEDIKFSDWQRILSRLVLFPCRAFAWVLIQWRRVGA
jgi:hypothetical protein